MKPREAITKVRTLRTASNNARESIGFIAQQLQFDSDEGEETLALCGELNGLADDLHEARHVANQLREFLNTFRYGARVTP